MLLALSFTSQASVYMTVLHRETEYLSKDASSVYNFVPMPAFIHTSTPGYTEPVYAG